MHSATHKLQLPPSTGFHSSAGMAGSMPLQDQTSRYAHTLLFGCPSCGLPVSVSRISHQKSLEGIARRSISLNCDYCKNLSETFAAKARMHWVFEWEDES